MSVAGTAQDKMVALLENYAPSPPFVAVYNTHATANLIVPSLSVEPETDIPLTGDSAIVAQELIDNRNVRLSILIHIGYRLGPVDTESATDITDAVIRWIRRNINLGDGYRVFDVVGAAYHVDHTTSGTTGAEITVDIHKAEFYEQI